jgi:Fe(3+) dicitrate transport protein
VEDAPPVIDRFGPTIDYGGIATTLTWEYTGRSYGDATNAISDPDNPSVGVIPAFHVLDLSLRADIASRYRLQVGVENLANARYFTFRAVEYPGPGIIPSAGRTVYAGLSITAR